MSDHSFSMIPRVEMQRSTFDRSSGYKTSFYADGLVPFFVDEVLPGDTFKLNATIFSRMSNPPIAPVMDNLRLDTFFFFVPNRLIWRNWQRFNGEQDNPGDSTDYTVPVAILNPVATSAGSTFAYTLPYHSAGDFMALPTNHNRLLSELGPLKVNALPGRLIVKFLTIGSVTRIFRILLFSSALTMAILLL